MRLSVYFLTLRRHLFEAPVTVAYAGWTLLLIGVAGSLVFANTLPAPLAYLLMLATLGWLARVCDSPVLRGAWLAAVRLLTLGLALTITPWLRS